MKKTIIVIGLICVVGAALFLGYALYTEKILVRLPMLVLEDPVITFSVGNGYYRETPAEKWKLIHSWIYGLPKIWQCACLRTAS